MPVSDFTKQNRQHALNTKSLLSTDFLDNLGSASSFSDTPIVFNSLESVLIKYGNIIAKGFSKELADANANASGGLDSSIRFEFTKLGQVYESSIYMSDYAKYVDEGVQGVNETKSINKTSPYKFKFSNPSKAHLEALEKWIKEKNVTATITAPKGIVSKTLSPASLAEAIGYSIKQRGLRATYFKRKTVERVIDDLKREVAAAIGNDIKVNILF